MGIIYAPYIDDTIPAFVNSYNYNNIEIDQSTSWSGGLKIPFTMNPAVGWNEVVGFNLIIKDLNSNQVTSIVIEKGEINNDDIPYNFITYNETTRTGMINCPNFRFSDLNDLIPFTYYKIQISYVSYDYENDNNISNVSVGRYIGEKPVITIEQQNNKFLYACQYDANEPIYSSRITVTNSSGQIIEDTGSQLYNIDNDIILQSQTVELKYDNNATGQGLYILPDAATKIYKGNNLIFNIAAHNSSVTQVGVYGGPGVGENEKKVLKTDNGYIKWNNIELLGSYNLCYWPGPVKLCDITVNAEPQASARLSKNYYELNKTLSPDDTYTLSYSVTTVNGYQCVEECEINIDPIQKIELDNFNSTIDYDNGLINFNQSSVYDEFFSQGATLQKSIDGGYTWEDIFNNDIEDIFYLWQDKKTLEGTNIINELNDKTSNIKNSVLVLNSKKDEDDNFIPTSKNDDKIYSMHFTKGTPYIDLNNLKILISIFTSSGSRLGDNNEKYLTLTLANSDGTTTWWTGQMKMGETKIVTSEDFISHNDTNKPHNLRSLTVKVPKGTIFDNFKILALVLKENSSETFIDNTLEQNQNILYRYKLLDNNNSLFYTTTNSIIPDFEDTFLSDENKQLKIAFNPKVSSLKNTILEAKMDTIGSQYPFFFRNGTVKYKEIPISGLISYHMDSDELFVTKEELGLDNDNNQRTATGSEPAAALTSPSTNLTGANIAAERKFRNEVWEWLNNGQPKLFRSPTEGNFIVRLMNVSLSPNEQLGRMLYSFSATGYEIAPANIENLKKYNLFLNRGSSNV